MKKVFGKRLKEMRLQKKLTIREASVIFYVSHTSYLHWEQGKSEPGIDTICAICEFFDVSADYLLGLSDII